MNRLRWVFFALFALLIAALLSLPITGMFGITWIDLATGSVLLGIFFGSQAIYIFGAGTMDLCRPIRKRRLWLPVAVGGVMLGILTGGIILAAVELIFGNRHEDWFVWLFFGLVGGCWIGVGGIYSLVFSRYKPS
jgi:hypothetical protein